MSKNDTGAASSREKRRRVEWTPKKLVMVAIFLAIVVISVYLFLKMLDDSTFLFNIIKDVFIIPLIDMGGWAVFVFLGLMILQSLIAPIPSELVLVSGAMIFGLWGGIVVGVIGSMLSAEVTYFISKKGGRPILDAAGEKNGIADRMLFLMDEWIDRWGLWAIIVGRAVPMIMFDPVSIAAGIAEVKHKHYSIATFIGSIPRSIFYSLLGWAMLGGRDRSVIKSMSPEEIETTANQFNFVFYTILLVLVGMLVLSNILSYVRDKKAKKAQPNVSTTIKSTGTEEGQEPVEKSVSEDEEGT
ncbi:MAG: TVP38/TMEM64 family protein [Promethearchaeota archaeon]